tara:strand:+ start:203078 stop:203746 length:669 start_codon:yes stop_codon:yes gene_type:complete
MKLKKSTIFLSVLFLIFYTTIFSQNNYKEFNVIGISAGLTQYDINTKDFKTQSRESFMFGLQMRGNVYNNFDMMYGIAFYDSNIAISAKSSPVGGTSRDLNYNLQSAQISVLGGYKIIKNHLSIEAGPVLNINGKLTLNDTQYENHIIEGYATLNAKDIEDVSKVNFHLAGGITAGLRNFRLFALYQYGVTNVLNNLNKNNLEKTNFKGNSTLLSFGVTVYL